MSDIDSTITAKEAKAEAKAAKARAKALKPWFKKPSRIIPLALVAVVGYTVATSGGESAPSDTGTSVSAPANEEKTESAAKVGDTVRDGKFEFTVTDVEKGVAEVGDEFLNEKAQGEYTLVSMKIENIGDEAQTFFVDNIKGVDSKDREVNSDSTGTLYANEGSDAWMSEINPGNAIEAVVVFDIAKSATLEQVVLQDSALSGGVTVEL